MKEFSVVRKSDQKIAYRYFAVEATEWVDFPYSEYDHLEVPAEKPPVNTDSDAEWRVYVGAFFDRFGAYKLPILASADPLVQAVVKDASVRKYIGLRERREELLEMAVMLQSKGFAVDVATVLDMKPSEQEVYRG